MSIYSPLANQIAAWLLVNIILCCLGYRAVWTAWVVNKTTPVERKYITQVDRLRMITFGWLCTIPTIIGLAYFGPVNIVRTLALTIDIDPTTGWFEVASTVFGALGIVFALLATYSVLFRAPSKFWNRTRDGRYILTSDRYRGIRHPISVLWIRSHRLETLDYYVEIPGMTDVQLSDVVNLHTRVDTNSDLPVDWQVYGGDKLV